MRALLQWLDDRAGTTSGWLTFADRAVPGGARLRHSFIAVILFLFAQAIVLGLVMATYYGPTASDAWASTAYFNDQVSGGWLVRGLHHHTSYALVVLTFLYLCFTAFIGAYRRPREIQWLAIVGLFALSMGMGLSGSLLSWDEQAAGRLAVETGIMSSTPGGAIVRRLLVGGSEFGNLTILRLYVAHVLLLPAAFVLLLVVVCKQLARHGVVTVGLSEKQMSRSEPFFPGQMFLDAVCVFVVSAFLVVVTVRTHGAELYAPASVDSTFSARPEWYFMPLSQLLKYFKGPLQLIGTVVLPAAAAGYVALLPWIDRAQSAKPSRRVPVLAGFGLVVAAGIGLGVIGFATDAKDPELKKSMEAAHKLADRARTLARQGVLPGGGDMVYWNDPQHKVRRLYKEHCQNCHAIDGIGGDEAPEFTDYASREWISSLVRDCTQPKFYGKTKHKDMEPYPEKDLSNADLKAIVEFVVSLAGNPKDEVDTALAEKGKKIFTEDQNCNDCHEYKKGETGSGPNLLGFGSTDYVSRAIRDTSAEALFGEEAEMPKFEKKLSPEEIEQLAEFVVQQGRPASPKAEKAKSDG